MVRLPTHLWVSAYIKRVQQAGAYATLWRKGDDQRGSICIRMLRDTYAHTLLVPDFDPGGDLCFVYLNFEPSANNSAQIDAYLEKLTDTDPDCWIIEIEGGEIARGAHYLTEPVRGIGFTE